MKTPVYLFAEPCIYCNSTGKMTMKPLKMGKIASATHWFFSCEPIPFDQPYETSCPICRGTKNRIVIEDAQGNKITWYL